MLVAGMIGEVPVMSIQKGVQVVNIVRLIEVLFPARSWNSPTYKEQNVAIKKWLEDNNAAYYADVKEDFFIHKGIHKAQEEGKDIVVVDNLS